MCAAMLLVISIQEVVVYRIIYMILFLYFVLSFQVMSRNWKIGRSYFTQPYKCTVGVTFFLYFVPAFENSVYLDQLG